MAIITTAVEPFNSSIPGQVHLRSSSRVSATKSPSFRSQPFFHAIRNAIAIATVQTTNFVNSFTFYHTAGGGGGIRTPDSALVGITVFKTAAFNRSATPPNSA